MSAETSNLTPAELAGQVRLILRRDWDAVGLSGEKRASDDYDLYVADIVALIEDLMVGRDALFDHLHDLAARHLGLPESEELTRRCDIAADALFDLRQSLPPG